MSLVLPHTHGTRAPTTDAVSTPICSLCTALTDIAQLAEAQQHIIDHCAAGPGTRVVPHPFRLGAWLFVKRGGTSLAGEARTQAYLFQQAQSSADAPSVPETYSVFNDGAGSTYLVTEHINTLSFRAWIDEPGLSGEEREDRTTTAVAAIADTIVWLVTRPLPERDMIGPVGGGHIQHSFFGMEKAPVPFTNAAALDKYVNEVCPTLCSRGPADPIFVAGTGASARKAQGQSFLC